MCNVFQSDGFHLFAHGGVPDWRRRQWVRPKSKPTKCRGHLHLHHHIVPDARDIEIVDEELPSRQRPQRAIQIQPRDQCESHPDPPQPQQHQRGASVIQYFGQPNGSNRARQQGYRDAPWIPQDQYYPVRDGRYLRPRPFRRVARPVDDYLDHFQHHPYHHFDPFNNGDLYEVD